MDANPETPAHPVKVSSVRKFALRYARWMLLAQLGLLTANLTAPWWWVSDLSIHFQIPASCLALTTLAAAGLSRQRGLFVVAICSIAWHCSYIAPLYIPRKTEAKPPGNAQSFRAMTYNVFAGNREQDAVRELLAKEQPDILCVEELTTYWHRLFKEEFAYNFATPTEGCFGGGIYSRYPLSDWKEIPLSADNTSLQVTVHLPDKELDVIVVHCFPPMSSRAQRQRNIQIRGLIEYLQHVHRPTIVMGDFNSTIWTAPMQELVHSTPFVDTTRGFGPQPSWPQGRPFLRIPIDQAFVTPDIQVNSRRIGNASGSDHLPVILDCQF